MKIKSNICSSYPVFTFIFLYLMLIKFKTRIYLRIDYKERNFLHCRWRRSCSRGDGLFRQYGEECGRLSWNSGEFSWRIGLWRIVTIDQLQQSSRSIVGSAEYGQFSFNDRVERWFPRFKNCAKNVTKTFHCYDENSVWNVSRSTGRSRHHLPRKNW